MLQIRDQTPGGVGLAVIDEHVQRIWLPGFLVDPDLQAVPLDVELGDELVGGYAAHPHRIYVRIGSVERDV